MSVAAQMKVAPTEAAFAWLAEPIGFLINYPPLIYDPAFRSLKEVVCRRAFENSEPRSLPIRNSVHRIEMKSLAFAVNIG